MYTATRNTEAQGNLMAAFSRYRDFARSAKELKKTPDEKFWQVSGDPSLNFESEYLIWRRAEYESLTEAIRNGLRQRFRIFIILGTEGCGKSLYAAQFALQRAHEGKVLFKKDLQVHIIDGRSEAAAAGPYTMTSPEVQELLSDSSVWLVIDGKQEEQLDCACKVLVACPTRKGNFRELAKLPASLELFMSAWSRDEVAQFVTDFEPYRAQYELVMEDGSGDPLDLPSGPRMSVPTLDKAMEAFKFLGGVARYVLSKNKMKQGLRKWRVAIEKLGTDVNLAATVLGGWYADDVSDSILHIFAEDNHQELRREFASDETVTELQQAYLKGGVAHAAAFLERTVSFPVAGALWGRLYESLAHKVLAAGNRSLRCKTWNARGVPQPGSRRIGPRKAERFKDLAELKAMLEGDIDEEAYMIPVSQSFESVDSFMRVDGSTVLVQIFKGKDVNHGQAAGLQAIDDVLCQDAYQVWSCVPAEVYESTGLEHYMNRHGEVYGGQTRVLGKISQTVVEVDYRPR